MALINCPECGKEVSDSAIACPHCGYEIKKDKTKKRKSNSGNLLSKITVTNALALMIQVTLVVFLFMNLITMSYEYDDRPSSGTIDRYWSEGRSVWRAGNYHVKSKDFSIVSFSFKNINKFIKNKITREYGDDGKYTFIKGGFSGAQVGLIILIALFLVVIGMMIFEFVKNKLLINPLFSSAIVFITEAYAIVAYLIFTNLIGIFVYKYPYWKTDYRGDSYLRKTTVGYFFKTQGLTMGKLFIILCIVCCVIKLINYWLHHDNKTESIKTISLKKLKKSKGAKEEIE